MAFELKRNGTRSVDKVNLSNLPLKRFFGGAFLGTKIGK
jgi:hypothetical protein